ncbi:Putative NADH-flavin reductase [Pseudomonas chlororaphis subsp. aureofaciens]|uniref:NADH-flavin reductase n=1 Tax=Pseudomonas chlororaphis subsp. aureofaciens TaxID=587851 RepID=A0AAD1E472_9PSED|nr:NAD(P)H-binding protein [Pseudomonas chlororaphis]AZE08355.1 Putative NADH-flavin reductase [Pseudomonas chlororaphis subsp. aureofaciens]AZE14534.1 Putative NADH-flavin reductase [Pseudomonas chlororaphis subsp. aureofaciens]AZE20497.1 Putative NADH-flavin reductase [Pseudomonas chlororaphis subsp. aureofaciens]AZE26855.1 Putative NADH-flavin reductase [Pseudomonas chlororaphis subsp. aureofaciens]AZE33103.1 Putative NADH-flavin reductase [Pseudomonas chlororaphis subsp. aureofaciens]
MKNAETPVVKLVIYGAMSSLGSALMAEFLRRQHEVIAILDDLTALEPLPGLRTKCGDLFDAVRVRQSVAGGDVVVCLLNAPGLPMGLEQQENLLLEPREQVQAVEALIAGMQAAGVRRLFLVGNFEVLDQPEMEGYPHRQTAETILDALQGSSLRWTLVNAPQSVPGLTLEHFSQPIDSLAPERVEPVQRLARVAAGIADEQQLNLHVGEHVNFVC